MQQMKRRVKYIVKCKGTPVLGSVCSFAHDHAILKMVDFLGKLEKANINNITCGGNGKLPVEYCEAEIDFEISDSIESEKIQEEFDALIGKTGYKGTTYKLVEDGLVMDDADLN